RDDGIRAREPARERARVREVGPPELDPTGGQLRHPIGVSDHTDHAHPALEQHVDQVATEKAGRSGDGDHGAAELHQPQRAAAMRSRTASATTSTGRSAKLGYGISSSTRTRIS